MIKKLIEKLFKPERSILDNESFIRIIQLAEEDPTVRHDIMTVLQMYLSNRNYALTKIVMMMRENKEPEDMIEAVSSLKEDKLARKILEYLAG